MELSVIRDLLTRGQASARVTTAIGDPVTVGDRVVIPVAEIIYAGSEGGGGGATAQADSGEGGGGGGLHVQVRPLGCRGIGPGDRWVPGHRSQPGGAGCRYARHAAAAYHPETGETVT